MYYRSLGLRLGLTLGLFLTTAVPAFAATPQAAGLPRSLDFLPPPPIEGSADFERDKAAYLQTRHLQGSPLWEQATFFAALRLDQNGGDFFKDAFGLRISKEQTPQLYALMEMLFASMGEADKSGKEHYNRVRPFMYFKAEGQTCAPQDEEVLRTNGSYSSGHTSWGWGMALVLAEISPERQAEIFRRGYEVGWSRVICGFHWASDVEAGRLVAAAVVSNLHSNPAFVEQLDKAKEEVRTLRTAAAK